MIVAKMMAMTIAYMQVVGAVLLIIFAAFAVKEWLGAE